MADLARVHRKRGIISSATGVNWPWPEFKEVSRNFVSGLSNHRHSADRPWRKTLHFTNRNEARIIIENKWCAGEGGNVANRPDGAIMQQLFARKMSPLLYFRMCDSAICDVIYVFMQHIQETLFTPIVTYVRKHKISSTVDRPALSKPAGRKKVSATCHEICP